MTNRSDLVRLIKALSYGAKNARGKTVIRTISAPDEHSPIKEVEREENLSGNKIMKVGLRKEKGWLYYLDNEGDIARTPMKKGGNTGIKKRAVKKEKVALTGEKTVSVQVNTPGQNIEVKKTGGATVDVSLKDQTKTPVNVKIPPAQNVKENTSLLIVPQNNSAVVKIETKPEIKAKPSTVKMKKAKPVKKTSSKKTSVTVNIKEDPKMKKDVNSMKERIILLENSLKKITKDQDAERYLILKAKLEEMKKRLS
jgi:hypothetical protein